MTIADITTLITNIGFPIVACVAMYNLCNKTIAQLSELIQVNTDILKEVKNKIDNL